MHTGEAKRKVSHVMLLMVSRKDANYIIAASVSPTAPLACPVTMALHLIAGCFLFHCRMQL